MEKFQIAKYGMMQVTAIVYGILACGLGVKLARPAFEADVPMNDLFYVAMFLRNYGVVLFAIVLGWASFCAYASSPTSRWDISEDEIVASAIGICMVLVMGMTFIALFASMSGMGDLIVSTHH